MTCAVCPNCGLDLERFEPLTRGDLDLNAYEVRWKGRRVPLRPSGRMIVSTLVRADGLPVSRNALAEAIGSDEAIDPANVVAAQLCFTKNAFRSIDPTFDAIENVWGTGLRWVA